jgi:hypothetical protein
VVAQFQTAQTLFFFQIYTYHTVYHAVEPIFVDYSTFEDDVWAVGMLEGKLPQVVHHTRMDEAVELLKGVLVGKDYLGNGTLVDTAVGEHNMVAKKSSYFSPKGGLEIVPARHFVGHETRDSEFLKLVEYSGLATANATCKGDNERLIG